MTQLYAIVEGDTEEQFFNQALAPHLAQFNIVATASRVVTSGRRGNAAAQGGGRRYGHWKDDLHSWISQQRHRPNVWFTTMLDYYGLANFTDDFPPYQEARSQSNINLRVRQLEDLWAAEIKTEIGFDRFIPYVQLHEFEALLLVNCSLLKEIFIEQRQGVDNLLAEVQNDGRSPEEINDGENTAPSKRIVRHIPEYADRKASSGPLAAQKIGLTALRRACPHFDQWICNLEAIAN